MEITLSYKLVKLRILFELGQLFTKKNTLRITSPTLLSLRKDRRRSVVKSVEKMWAASPVGIHDAYW